MSLLMSLLSLNRSYLVVSAVLLLVAGIGVGGWLHKPRSMQFDSPADFEKFTRQKGYWLHSGAGNLKVMPDNFFVLDHPVELEQLGRLTKADCGETPAWKGIVWVANCESGQNQPRHSFSVCPGTIGGHWRLWGKVLAAGDPELLDRLEELYHQQ